MSTYTLDELMGSLQVHETRLNRSEERDDTKAFYAKGDSSRSQQQGQGSGKGRGKPSYNQPHSNQPKRDVECYYCHRFGHVKADCFKKKREEGVECHYCHKLGHVQADCYEKKRDEEQASFVEEESNQARLFMAKTSEESDLKNQTVEGRSTEMASWSWYMAENNIPVADTEDAESDATRMDSDTVRVDPDTARMDSDPTRMAVPDSCTDSVLPPGIHNRLQALCEKVKDLESRVVSQERAFVRREENLSHRELDLEKRTHKLKEMEADLDAKSRVLKNWEAFVKEDVMEQSDVEASAKNAPEKSKVSEQTVFDEKPQDSDKVVKQAQESDDAVKQKQVHKAEFPEEFGSGAQSGDVVEPLPIADPIKSNKRKATAKQDESSGSQEVLSDKKEEKFKWWRIMMDVDDFGLRGSVECNPNHEPG